MSKSKISDSLLPWMIFHQTLWNQSADILRKRKNNTFITTRITVLCKCVFKGFILKLFNMFLCRNDPLKPRNVTKNNLMKRKYNKCSN